jgi:hypothetical protein
MTDVAALAALASFLFVDFFMIRGAGGSLTCRIERDASTVMDTSGRRALVMTYVAPSLA